MHVRPLAPDVALCTARFALRNPQAFAHADMADSVVAAMREGFCPIALGTTAPVVASRNRADTGVVVTQIRPPTSPESFDFAFFLLPSLRAPPPLFTLI